MCSNANYIDDSADFVGSCSIWIDDSAVFMGSYFNYIDGSAVFDAFICDDNAFLGCVLTRW